MAYSIQQGQTCTICLSDDLVGKFEKTSLYSETPMEVTRGKVLRCAHAFHEICINLHLAKNGSSCPNCRTSIEGGDRSYGMTEDLTHPEGFIRSFSNQTGDHRFTYFCQSSIPESVRELCMKEAERRLVQEMRGADQPASSSQESTVFYIDEDGVSHSQL